PRFMPVSLSQRLCRCRFYHRLDRSDMPNVDCTILRLNLSSEAGRHPMLQAFVITLREGLEAFLIVAISLAYLRKSGRRELVPAVHWGIALSLVISIGAAFLFERAANH